MRISLRLDGAGWKMRLRSRRLRSRRLRIALRLDGAG